MTDRPYNLAIETSSRQGSITLGRGDQTLESIRLSSTHRHSVGLMPGIDQLCRRHHIDRTRIAQLYLSHGPGSFTGLRVAIAAAKMLALALDVRLVAVPTLEVLAENAPRRAEHLAVCLNQKRGSVYAGLFQRLDDAWQRVEEPGVQGYVDLLGRAPRPLHVLSPMLPELNDQAADALLEDVTILAPEQAIPRSEAVYHHGRRLARANHFASPHTLEPLYARQPEAVTLWQQRHHQPAESPATANTKSTSQP